VRQQIFRQAKHFQCDCTRCRDPTELGTYLSAVLCPACHGLVSLDYCQQCDSEYPGDLQSDLTQLASKIASGLVASSSCSQLREGLAFLRSVLGQNHHILTTARQALILHAGHCKPCRADPSYLACSVEMLQLINKLQPGHTRARLDGE